MDGVINFFKPKGMTSHDAVYLFRRLLKTKKVGHTGTLDPNATGVLPICIGKGTRISEYLLNVDKEYIGELTLGSATDTQDNDGKIILSSDKVFSEEEIYDAFSKFQGQIIQIPPMYSALKHKGKKLYEYAREGISIEREGRETNIKDLKILNNNENNQILFYTRCSRGTYIRTLCHDIGLDLGNYGHMSYLIRVGVGSFKINNAYGMDTLMKMNQEELLKTITPIDKSIEHLGKIELSINYYKMLCNGMTVEVNNTIPYYEDLLRIYCGNKFIGVGRLVLSSNKTLLKFDKVLI